MFSPQLSQHPCELSDVIPRFESEGERPVMTRSGMSMLCTRYHHLHLLFQGPKARKATLLPPHPVFNSSCCSLCQSQARGWEWGPWEEAAAGRPGQLFFPSVHCGCKAQGTVCRAKAALSYNTPSAFVHLPGGQRQARPGSLQDLLRGPPLPFFLGWAETLLSSWSFWGQSTAGTSQGQQ